MKFYFFNNSFTQFNDSEVGLIRILQYIKYIKLIITEDNNNCLSINDIELKNKVIKNRFISNYKNILIYYLSNKNDKIIIELFSDVNSVFFEKQIILDILLDKIKSDKQRNFKVLNVHLICNMDLELSKIDISQYKNKDIIIIQDSKTGEIYDFGIIVDNSVKLYKVSTNKSKEDLLKMDKNLIEFDCDYMINSGLYNIGEYKNFSFGIITNTSTFDNYSKLLGQKKEITNTPYYLMKEYCLKNNYELLVYDLRKQKIYIEDDSNKLIEYELYKFNIKNKLNIPELKNNFTKKTKKFQ